MRVFPQLVTGAMAQYQIRKQVDGPAVANRAADGSTYIAADPLARRVIWSLGFTGLNSAEFAALDQLFAVSEGRLGTFTFLDPTMNLLGWTENLAAVTWQKDATLAVVGGPVGPVGDGFELANSGQNWAEIWQTIAAPADFTYAFSVWVRGTGAIRLRRFGGAASEQLEFGLTAGWKRIELNGALGASGDAVSFAIGVPDGGQVDVAGPMVEAQLVAGEYKKSVGRGGVYSAARFATDSLQSRVEAMDWIDARVSVESRFED